MKRKKILSLWLTLLFLTTLLTAVTVPAGAEGNTFKPTDKLQKTTSITMTNNHDGTITLGNFPTFEGNTMNNRTIDASELAWGYSFTSKCTDLPASWTYLKSRGGITVSTSKLNPVGTGSMDIKTASTPYLVVYAYKTPKTPAINRAYFFGYQIFTLPTKIIYNLTGGTAGSGFVAEDWVLSGQEWLTNGSTVNHTIAPTKAGYTFDGWYTAAEGGTKVTTTAEADTAASVVDLGNSTAVRAVTLYAHWTEAPSTHDQSGTLTFDNWSNALGSESLYFQFDDESYRKSNNTISDIIGAEAAGNLSGRVQLKITLTSVPSARTLTQIGHGE